MFRKIHSQIDLLRQGMPCLYNEIIYLNIYSQRHTRNSLYVRHLLKQLKIAVREHTYIEEVFRQIRQAVGQESAWKQQPYSQSSLSKDFCFWSCPEPEFLLTVRSDLEGGKVFINRRFVGYIQNGKKIIKQQMGRYNVYVQKTTFGGSVISPNKVIYLNKDSELYVSTTLPQQNTSVTVRLKDSSQIHKISSVALSSDGNYALAGGDSRTLWLWNLKTGKMQAFSGHSDIIASVAFSPNGRYALSGSRDRKVLLWEMKNGSLRHSDTYQGHSGLVSSVCFSPDSHYALSGSYDKTMRLWNNNSRTLDYRFRGNLDWVLSTAFSRTDKIIVGSKNKMSLWRTDGSLVQTFRGYSYFHAVTFFPDGNTILSGNSDNTVQHWHVNGRQLKTFKGHTESVRSVAVAPEANYVVSGSRDNTVRLWDVNTSQIKHTLHHTDDVYSVRIFPQGHRILSAGNDGIYLWNAITGAQIARLLVFKDGSWLIMMPTGFFTGSDKRGQKLSILLRGSELPNNASFYSPDKVRTALTRY